MSNSVKLKHLYEAVEQGNIALFESLGGEKRIIDLFEYTVQRLEEQLARLKNKVHRDGMCELDLVMELNETVTELKTY